MADIFDKIAPGPVKTGPVKTGPVNTASNKAASNLLGPDKKLYISKLRKPVGRSDIFSSFGRGLQSGALGTLLGAEPSKTPKDIGFLGQLAQGAGEIASDIPTMALGGLLGAPAGPIAASATAFATPTLIKQVKREWHKFEKKDKDLNLTNFLKHLKSVGKETGKSAIMGLAMGGLNKALPLLSKIPAISKFIKSQPATAALGKGAAELATLSGTQAGLEGELPTKEQLAQNALLLGGMKLASKGASKIRPKIKEGLAKTGEKYKEFKTNQLEQKKYFDKLKEHVGARDVEYVKSQFKWRRALDSAEKAGKFTPKNREEMIYYRQRTGNPEIKGDTFEKLNKRLPENAKKFVDKTIDNHLSKQLLTWNKEFATQKIKPRVALENIYLPEMYKYDPKAMAKASNIIHNQDWKTKLPFANKKSFLTYNEAVTKAGLKPKYKDMIGLMRNFDDVISKTKANIKLLDDVKSLEKEAGKKLIVTSDNPVQYNDAKAANYKRYWDPMLRRQLDPKTGKYKISDKPALVDPNFSQAFQGIFAKDPYKYDPFALRAYDKAGDIIRTARVLGSPFHYVALGESAIGSLGLQGFRFPTLMKKGNKLRANEDFMRKAARAGLKVESGIEDWNRGLSSIDKVTDKLLTYTKPGSIPHKVLNKFINGQNYLFRKFHPNLKAVTFDQMSNEMLKKARAEKGSTLTIKEGTKINREVAQVVNNVYGGQQWETQRMFNSPQNRKWLRRFIAYPDWSKSALSQAGLAFKGGVKGQLGRAYWLKYGLGISAITALNKYFMGGLKNNENGRVVFDFDKAKNSLLNGDPSKWNSWELPDINITLGNTTFNPGRDKNDKKLYAHMGKQMLEIGHYFTEPVSVLFSKSNPIFQMAFKQAVGGTPWKDSIFIERGKWARGDYLPWDASKSWTLDRLSSRMKSLVGDLIPFGISNLMDRGAAPWAAAGFGAVPISKGLNQYTAVPYMEEALSANDNKKLKRIETVLKKNGVADKNIKTTISRVKNGLMLDGKIKGLTLNGNLTTRAIRSSLKRKDYNKLERVIKTLKKNGFKEESIEKRILTLDPKFKGLQ